MSWASPQQKATWAALWRNPPAASIESRAPSSRSDYEAAAAAMNTRQQT